MSNEIMVVGLNIRKDPSGRSAKLGLLPRDACIEIGERSADGKWGRIKQVVEGKIAPVRQGGEVDPAAATGWVFLGELDAEPGDPEAFDSIVVPSKPRPIKAGELVGYLGEYQQQVDARPVAKRGWRPQLHLEVFSGDNVPEFLSHSRSYASNLPVGSGALLVIESGARLVSPDGPDITLAAGEQLRPVTDSPNVGLWVKVCRISVQALEKARLGTFHEATNSYANGATWTGWYVGASDNQRTRSREEANRKGYTRREVLVPLGKPLWVDRRLGVPREPLAQSRAGWSTFPLKLKNAKDPEVGLTRILSRAELEQAQSNAQAVDPEGNRWWRVDVRSTSTSSKPGVLTTGWVCEKGHDKVAWQSAWAWPGFDFVEEGGIAPIDMLSNLYHHIGVAEPGEGEDFKARADKVDKSALVQKLHEFIDVNDNDSLEAHEVRNAARDPLLAQSLSRLIARYESEWGGEMAKWDALDPLMVGSKAEWKAEKLRIDQLRWWPKVVGKVKEFPSSPLAFHFHPIGLVANFMASGSVSGGCACSELTAKQLQAIANSASKENVNKYVAAFNQAFTKFKMSECINRAHFLAQVVQESTHLKDTRELGKKHDYDPWRGRGLLQVTLKANYEAYQKYIGEDCTSSKAAMEKLESAPHSVYSAVWFWAEYKGLNKHGDNDDFIWCTRIVNGGFNHYDHRLQYLNQAIKAFNAQGCTKLNRNGVYKFEESKAYNERNASFAWGLWSDPDLGKQGKTKNRADALAGYRRYLKLHDAAGTPEDKGWYKIGKKTLVRAYAEQRIRALED